MRLFIAVDCEELKDYFKEIQNKIPKDIAKTKPVNSFHLTLKFLGETDKLEEIKSSLSKIKFKPFKLTTYEIGVFPSEGYVRVVWIGLKDNNHLNELQKKIEDALEEFHFRKDFEFAPHLTLCRVKFISNKIEFIKKLKEIKIEQREMEVKSFKLIKSELRKEGPVYEDMAKFKAVLS